MKYWFFDGSDVTGPFTVKELSVKKSFSETSLVCPENFSDDGEQWQLATSFADLKQLFVQESAEEEETVTLEQEMDTLLKERSPLLFERVPTDGPGLQIPKKPAKPGPIEDYFNNIKEDDLGDILGIPDPNDNSDLDLAHALEKQLAKTSSTRREQLTNEETDQQTAAELTSASQTHHVATATEVFATKVSEPTQEPKPKEEKQVTMPVVESPYMPTLASEEGQSFASPTVSSKQEENPVQTGSKELISGAQPDTVQPAGQPNQVAATPIPDPALLRREKVEVNSIRARLKQTQEMKDFLHETQNARLKKQAQARRRLFVMLLALFVIAGGLLIVVRFRSNVEDQNVSTTQEKTLTTHELLPQAPVIPNPPAVAAEAQPALTHQQQALSIVQNYRLSGDRGTLGNYLNRIYQSQLSQGYTGTWAVEPLYKNAYIVKYRLTKTRKEPIIYIFQADVAQGKLTGALNNISLDLVGKL